MQPLIANLWVLALIGFGVCAVALQRRFASLRLLMVEQHPQLAFKLGADPSGRNALPSATAVLRWLIAGQWHEVNDPLMQAFAATCLRLLRLCMAWLAGLLAALLLLG